MLNESSTIDQQHIDRLNFIVRHRGALSWVFGVLFAILLSGGLISSMVTAQWGLIVFGSPTHSWSKGMTVALRVEARQLPFQEQVYLTHVEVSFEQEDIHVQPMPQLLTERAGDFLQGRVQLPAQSGHWTCIVRAKGYRPQKKVGRSPTDDDLIELFARFDFDLDDQLPAWDWPGTAKSAEPYKGREGDASIKLFSASQRVPFGLNSALITLVRDSDGVPIQTTVNISPRKGIHSPKFPNFVHTDQYGLARFNIRLESPSLFLNLSALNSSSYLQLWPEAHQLSLTPSQQTVGRGGVIRVDIESSIRTQGTYYIDLWWQGVWVSTQSIRAQGATLSTLLQIPEDLIQVPNSWGLLWVQVYRTPYLPDEVRGGSYLILSDTQKSSKNIHKKSPYTALIDQLKKEKIEADYWEEVGEAALQSPLPLQLALSMIKRPAGDPEVLIDSAVSAQETARRLRARYLKSFVTLMCVTCFLILGLIGWLLWASHRSSIHSSTIHASILNTKEQLMWFGAATLVLFTFFGGMIYLFQIIRW